jgi:mRNA interferase RelE/StbE
VSAPDEYDLVVTPPAARAISEHLPEPVAAAVIEFLTTALIREPRRVGKPLRRELAGVWSARRGTYRILYRVHDDPCDVVVLRVEHRGDVYRPRYLVSVTDAGAKARRTGPALRRPPRVSGGSAAREPSYPSPTATPEADDELRHYA